MAPPSQHNASCAKTAAAAVVAWRGGRAPPLVPEGQVQRHVLWYVPRSNFLRHILRRVLHVHVFHMSPKGSAGGGMRMFGVGFRRWKTSMETAERRCGCA